MFPWIVVRKKIQVRYGTIELANKHPYSEAITSFKMSPRYQELLTYVGQESPYLRGTESLQLLLGLGVSDSQLHRLTTHHGEAIEELLLEAEPVSELKPTDQVYLQVDGSMVYVREEGWKEVKLGRCFKARNRVDLSESRTEILHSSYRAHLGTHQAFEQKMEVLIDPYESLGERLIVVSDGAPWIANWVKAAYPKASMILDFFHACEYLSEFTQALFGPKNHQTQYEIWVKQLKEKGGVAMIQTLKEQECRTKKAQEAKEKILRYYQQNQYRMDYPTYLQQGYFIGSGAIEAAHRTVIQKRLKLSGQRWTKEGAQKVLNIRTLNMSGQWNQFQQMLRAA